MGTQGCVSFMFSLKGVVVLNNEDGDIGRLCTHGFIGNLCKNGFTIHLFNSRDVRSFEGRTVNSVPSLTLVVKRFVDGKVADRLDIDVWEYADISKAIDAAKAFIG